MQNQHSHIVPCPHPRYRETALLVNRREHVAITWNYGLTMVAGMLSKFWRRARQSGDLIYVDPDASRRSSLLYLPLACRRRLICLRT